MATAEDNTKEGNTLLLSPLAGRALVVVVVVVVLTVCLDHTSVHATKRPAPNSGQPRPMTPLALCGGPCPRSLYCLRP